ncbi:hypothetical protein HPP92_014897 [Vanilla planifolia]|uniref:Uncharacterized protein n=1 Tax=Vanilla planifolia TaxID=51239 RepID=A0A835QMG5_VANPL|nr:hypothetical protein HPP92_014897 [Vanilla planifolia]
MDIRYHNRNRFQGLMVLSIWCISAFSNTDGSAPQVSPTNKEISNPSVMGCLLSLHYDHGDSYFYNHSGLSDPKFNDVLNVDILSGDSCDGIIYDIEMFGLSSLTRYLIGEGSHRQLFTSMLFDNQPEIASKFHEHSCVGILIERLPAGVFADHFQLQHLVNHNVFLGAYVHGDRNLELPSALSNGSIVEVHTNIRSDADKLVVRLPLHARYPPVDSSGYANITIGRPDVFMRCRQKGSKGGYFSWFFIDMGSFSKSIVTWRIPSGYEAHAWVVTTVTFLSALVCSVLIILSSLYFM